MQTTDVQKAYQEFIRLFRFLRNELERQLPDFRLKLVVVFDHRNFRLEVWLSGVNRTAQCRWAEQWRACPPPMELTQEPNHTDFVVRLPVKTELSDGEKTVAVVREAAVQLLQLLPPIKYK